jgi:hypothetical protein
MIFVKKIIEPVGLKIKLPMIFKLDRKGAKDLTNLLKSFVAMKLVVMD